MPWYVPLFDLVVRTALGSLLLLAVAAVGAACVRQPARRVRWIECALFGCLALFPLCLAPGLPHWSTPRWLKPATATQVQLGSRVHAQGKVARAFKDPQLPTENHPSVGTAPPIQAGNHRPAELLREPFQRIDPRLFVVLAYLSGAGLMVTWWFTGILALRCVAASAREADERCRRVLRAVAGPADVRVRLMICRRAGQPFTFGLRRATIVLPEALAMGDERRLRWALAHEWSHIERGDLGGWSLAGVVRIVLFYQPLVWWLRGQLRLAQDYLADAAAADHGAEEDYAEFLTSWASVGRRPAYGLGIVGPRSELTRRVVMLVHRRRALAPRCSRGWTVFAALLAIALAAVVGTYRAGGAEDRKVTFHKTSIQEPKTPSGEADAKEASVGNGASRKPQLRYAGRDFDDWRNQLLNDLEPQTRMKAIQALEAFGKSGYAEEASEAIAEALESDDSNVIVTATGALSKIGAPALPVLVEALKSERTTCRLFAARALGLMGTAAVSAAHPLAERCHDELGAIRRTAAEAIARIAYQSDALNPLLDRLIRDEDAATRCGMVHGLGEVFTSHVQPLPLLLAAADDSDPEARSEVARALALHAPATDEVIAALKRLVDDRDPNVRDRTIRALLSESDNAATAVPVLADVLTSADLLDQLSAAENSIPDDIIESIGKPGPAVDTAVAALAKYIKPGVELQTIRVVKAIDILGNLGPAAKEAIPAIESWNRQQRIHFGKGDSIQNHARRALRKIGGEENGAPNPEP